MNTDLQSTLVVTAIVHMMMFLNGLKFQVGCHRGLFWPVTFSHSRKLASYLMLLEINYSCLLMTLSYLLELSIIQ